MMTSPVARSASCSKARACLTRPAACVNILESRRRNCDGVDNTHKTLRGWCASATGFTSVCHHPCSASLTPRGFQLMRRRWLKGSELLAEPRLAELASHEGRLHPNAPLRILEDEAVATKKGSCEMQRDGVEMQVGYKRRLECAESRHDRLVPRNSVLHLSPVGQESSLRLDTAGRDYCGGCGSLKSSTASPRGSGALSFWKLVPSTFTA